MPPPPVPLTCPRCGDRPSLVCYGKRHALYPVAYMAVLPMPLAMLHQVMAPVDYQCRACGQSFTRRSRIAKLSVWLFWLAILIGLVQTIFYFS